MKTQQRDAEWREAGRERPGRHKPWQEGRGLKNGDAAVHEELPGRGEWDKPGDA
jgi:hypothetical protein